MGVSWTQIARPCPISLKQIGCLLELTVLDATDAPLFDVPPDPIDHPCGVCGVSTDTLYQQRGGRGRHPKYCAEHQGTKTTAPSSGKGRRSNVDSLVAQITEFHAQVGEMGAMFGPIARDAMVISAHASRLGEAWRPVLERDEAMRRRWERFFTTSSYTMLILGYGSVAFAILQNHGLMPKPVGVEPPPPVQSPFESASPFGSPEFPTEDIGGV